MLVSHPPPACLFHHPTFLLCKLSIHIDAACSTRCHALIVDASIYIMKRISKKAVPCATFRYYLLIIKGISHYCECCYNYIQDINTHTCNLISAAATCDWSNSATLECRLANLICINIIEHTLWMLLILTAMHFFSPSSAPDTTFCKTTG